LRPSRCRSPIRPCGWGATAPGAFRRVVTLGDGWHATSKTPAEFEEAAGRLRKAADAAGRPFETIELSLRFALKDDLLAQGAPAVIDALAAYARVGCRHVMLEFRRDDLARMLDILEMVTSRVQPALAAA